MLYVVVLSFSPRFPVEKAHTVAGRQSEYFSINKGISGVKVVNAAGVSERTSGWGPWVYAVAAPSARTSLYKGAVARLIYGLLMSRDSNVELWHKHQMPKKFSDYDSVSWEDSGPVPPHAVLPLAAGKRYPEASCA